MKREQKPKPVQAGRNEAWMRERLEQSNRNLVRPGKNGYKRPKAGARNKEW
jgi:hypothetical protein